MLRQLIASFIIVAICVVIHIGGIVLLAEWLLDRHLERNKRTGMMSFTPVLIIIFAIFIVLHMTETAIWAAFYFTWNLFPDFETALYYSLTSYTTIGFGDVVLPEKWRLLGGIEGITGVLLSGLSAAYIFVVLNSLFSIRSTQSDEEPK